MHDAVEIFGTDYPTRDGTPVRDYIHVEDLGRAHLFSLEAAREGEHNIYNLGNGAGFSVREVIEAAHRVTGRCIKTVESPRRPGDPAVVVASSDKVRSELGWKPEKPELEAMISDAWNWLLTYSHEAQPGFICDRAPVPELAAASSSYPSPTTGPSRSRGGSTRLRRTGRRPHAPPG
jgi:UDP-glucose 4-epimerase